MPELIALSKVKALNARQRKKLAVFWITSVEEFVSTARSSNQQHGSGRAAMANALGISEERLIPIIEAAAALLPEDASFDVPVEQGFGDGLFLEEYTDADATPFAVPTSLPSQVEPLFSLPRPTNQGERNSCVAFTLAAAYQVLSKDATDLSEQFLYWACKDRDGIPGDVGTDPIKAASVLQNVGICSEAVWPYRPAPRDDTNPGQGPPPPAALAEAAQRRIKGFQKLPATSVPQLKAALYAGKPVLIGLRIWEHWTGSWQGSSLGRLRQQLPGERARGGHAMCVLGYRDTADAPGGGYFIVRNSWGADWAKTNPDGPGYCHVPYSLIAEQCLAAIAFEGVITTTGAVPAANGQAGAVSGGGTAKPLGGAGLTLQELYAESRELQSRLEELVTGLAALVSTPTGVGDPVNGEPPAPVNGAVTSDERARVPLPTLRAPSGARTGPLILISQSAGPEFEDLAPNGVAPSGERLLRIDAASAARLSQARAAADTREQQKLYKARRDALRNHYLGLVADIDEAQIGQTRWAVVINAFEQADLINAIWPLIEHRMRQMGLTPPAVSFRPGENATTWMSRHSDGFNKNLKNHWGQIPPVLIYRPDERVGQWLARHGVENGPVDPRRGVPFYLLLLGRPGPIAADDTTAIPFGFQYELDIFYGVGRVCFTDAQGRHRLEDYTTYAERLVGWEQRQDAADRLRKELVLFATRHAGDKSTMRSADELVGSLARWHDDPANLPLRSGFAKQSFLAAQATRSSLEQILTGDGKAPAMLFTATHGLGLPLSDERLMAHQGALVLQDWDGIGNVKREHWFAGEDLASLSPRVEGTLAFIFACYGAGCPDHDEFIFDEVVGRPQIANFPLIAQLPQQLLINGAIGVIGHIERAWTFSFGGLDGAKAQSQPFEDVLGRLMQGRRLGAALDQFDVIKGARSMTLASELENIKFGKIVDSLELARLWIARNDARNYVLLGDPAARLPY